MKFFHLGDLHFGKSLHNVALVEADQPYWVDQFIKAVDDYDPDAVVIAGDVYDRKVPSPEAMKLFDHLLTELARRDKYVFVIPGNHDSSIRLSHVNELLTSHKIYIAGELGKELMHVTVSNVTFWLMPYIFPKLVADKRVLDRDDLSTYDEAARALLGEQDIDGNECNVLLAHQNVLANGVEPEHSESETYIGGLGEIDYSAFDSFDYVALGHIHNAQKVGRETIRYAGCPLYYDFSEINRDKRLTMVTINSKDDISVRRIEIPILHTLLQQSGTLEELLAAGMALDDVNNYYVQCVLRDKHVPPHALEQLRGVYGRSLVNVKRDLSDSVVSSGSITYQGEDVPMNLDEQFGAFFQEMHDELLDGDQEELVQKILEQQSRQGGDYYLDFRKVPEEDSEELLDTLINMIDGGDAV